MSADYQEDAISHISGGVATAVLLVVTVTAGILFRKDRRFALGGIFMALGLLPTANIIPLYRPMADRFLYLPMIGVSVCILSLASWVASSKRRTLARAGLPVD